MKLLNENEHELKLLLFHALVPRIFFFFCIVSIKYFHCADGNESAYRFYFF